MFWKNPDFDKVINSRIIEWDIKSGNTSIMRAFNLCPIERIQELEEMKKQDRVIAVGNMMKDSEFSKKLEAGFNQVVNEFMELNGLNKDDDVLRIMRDAVYVINNPIKYDTIREYCHFIPKNEYIGYFFLSPYEFFISQHGIDVKGIDDEKLKSHENGTLRVIRDVYDACVEYNMDQVKINAFMKGVVDAYIHRDLEFDAYREFNNESNFRINMYGHEVLSDAITERDLSDVDISFNYLKIIIPLIKLLC